DGPAAGTGHRRAHRGEPVYGHDPADHQLPGGSGRNGDPAHGERRPGQNADVHYVRAAGLLPEQRGGELHDAVCQPERRLCLQPRQLRRGDRHHLRRHRRPRRQEPRPPRHPPPRRAKRGPNSAGAYRGQFTVPGSHTKGTWVDETDIRPTMMYLTGLTDDYEHDGRVITQILANPNKALRAGVVPALGECYKQLNSSVGKFGTATLQFATKGIESTSPGDSEYLATDRALVTLGNARDRLAGVIKQDLENAAFHNTQISNAGELNSACQSLIDAAQALTGQ